MNTFDNVNEKYGLDEISGLYEKYVGNAEMKEDVVLYHYTDNAGLKGILSSRSFWFTDYRSLKDPTEVTHSLSLIEKIILEEEWKKNEALNLFLLLLKESLNSYVIGTLSFLAGEKDYLPAWREYGGNCAGFTLGIRLQELKKLYCDSQPETTSWISGHYSIDYVSLEFKKYVRKMFLIFQERLNRCSTFIDKENCFKEVGVHIGAHLLPLLPQNKHVGYKEEKEYRFVMIERNPLDGNRIINVNSIQNERGYFLRPNKKENSPFINPIPTVISEQFDKSIISEIGIGPSNNKQQARHYIEKLLKEMGYSLNLINIYDSQIPFRG